MNREKPKQLLCESEQIKLHFKHVFRNKRDEGDDKERPWISSQALNTVTVLSTTAPLIFVTLQEVKQSTSIQASLLHKATTKMRTKGLAKLL